RSGPLLRPAATIRMVDKPASPFGQSPLSTNPNATLLYVTGFDQATSQFKYRVNQLFGERTNFGSARRKFAPTQLQISVEYVFDGPVLNPIARGLGLREQANQRLLRREAVVKLKRDHVLAYARLRIEFPNA
ncbi:MAG TPA: hypothetical protein VIK50_16880, partial [Gemmatimonadaceae bacterium]